VTHEVRVAAFRPDDERLTGAVELLDSLGATPVPDPMLTVEPTGAVPGDGTDSRSDPDIVVLTSKTGVELLAESGWSPGDAAVACIGPKTAAAARDAGGGRWLWFPRSTPLRDWSRRSTATSAESGWWSLAATTAATS
jgi:uroporphyrinogen-III synthase